MTKFWVSIPLCLLALALPITIAPINIALGLLTFGLLLSALLGRTIAWRQARNAAVYALIAYCLVGVFVSVVGVNFSVSLPQLYRDFHKLWVLTLLLITIEMEAPAAATWALGAGFTIAAVNALEQIISGKGLDGSRAHAFVHPVTFGEDMAIAVLGGLCLLYGHSTSKLSTRTRSVTLLFILICGAALFFSQTRAAFLGLLIGYFVLCLAHTPMRKQIPWLMSGAALGFLTWQMLPHSRSFTLATHETRLTLWSVAWHAFKDHPWTGVGIGNYKTVFTHYFSGSLEGESVWGSAHNLYLHNLAERGLMGLAALIYVFTTLTLRAWRRVQDNPHVWNLWALSALIAFLVMNLTEIAFQNEQMATLILFLWARAESDPNDSHKKW